MMIISKKKKKKKKKKKNYIDYLTYIFGMIQIYNYLYIYLFIIKKFVL